MKVYLNSTGNLGDFLNALPVISGLVKENGKIDFVIRPELKKFKGIKEFLMYQDLFSDVNFEDEIFSYNNNYIILSSWTREDRNDINRPIETCRYENFLKDTYGLKFEVDDNFEIKFPMLDLPIDQTKSYIGDRWNVGNIDARRATGVLAHMVDKYNVIDYDNDILTNCYLIKQSEKPFITNLTGVSVLADLLNKEQFVIWKAEDWNPEFRNGDNINWDNGKDINTIFQKHFYANRKSKLIHAKDFE
ncbi:MAG: hypothetical protein WCG15_00975 [Actinomycetes bacterium]|jgi:hypothetical protein